MHLVVFGLCMSSSWGNRHATLWRGLVKALARRGHTVTFYERDMPWYAAARDDWQPPAGVHLRLYSDFAEVRAEAARHHALLALDLKQQDVAKNVLLFHVVYPTRGMHG